MVFTFMKYFLYLGFSLVLLKIKLNSHMCLFYSHWNYLYCLNNNSNIDLKSIKTMFACNLFSVFYNTIENSLDSNSEYFTLNCQKLI